MRRIRLDLKIRPFQLHEIEQLVELWKASLKDPTAGELETIIDDENVQKYREKIIELHREDENQILVAEVNGKLLGYIHFLNPMRTRWGLKAKYYWSPIVTLYVQPGFRRRRIGTQLMQKCLDYLRSKGATRKELDVWADNKEAINFYRKFNFEIIGLILRKSLT